MSKEIKFDLGPKLPWVDETVLDILKYAPGGSPKEKHETKLRKITISVYSLAVTELWQKAFGAEHVCTKKKQFQRSYD